MERGEATVERGDGPALLEQAGVGRAMPAGRVLLDLVRGFELQRLLDPRIDVSDFEQRVEAVLRGLLLRRDAVDAV